MLMAMACLCIRLVKMWWIKLVGSVFIFVGCFSIYMEKTRFFTQRIRMLREMERSLNIFQDMTQTYRLPLEIIFQKISQQVDEPVAVFFRKLSQAFAEQNEKKSEDIWRKTLQGMKEAFDKNDQVLFLQMEAVIGGQNMDLQKQIVNNCCEQIRQRINELEAKRPELEKVYRVLTFTVSGFLILLFI